MASDLDRYCYSLERDLDVRIDRIDAILSRFPRSRFSLALTEARNADIIALHEMRNAHARYDARRAEADSDPTGQDADAFDVGESSHGWQACGGGYKTDGRGGYREDFGG